MLAGLSVPLGAHITPLIREALEDGSYEAAELAAIRATLLPGDTVMELGTGLGLVSAYCATIVGSDRTFTFEANAALEQPIRTLYAANGVAPRLEMCMLGERAGAAVLHVEGDFWGSSTVAARTETRRVEVAVRAFDDLRRAIDPSFLVIDIEGGELDLLGYADLGGVCTVVIELHPSVIGEEGCETVMQLLARGGFEVVTEHSSWDVYTLQRTGSHAEREVVARERDALAHLPSHRSRAALQTLREVVPENDDFVLVDDDLWWQGDEFGDRRRRHLVERDGRPWGMPEDGRAAVRELQGHRSRGVRFVVVAWPAFWWLDEFSALDEYLAGQRMVFESRDLRIWRW